MELLIQPESGIAPILSAIGAAETSVDVVIFRADLKGFQKAFEGAVARGVAVHALVAHTNRGGEQRLRKLEQALLEAGVTVSRTGDDFVRYHGKILIVDKRTLFVLGFNYTDLDVFKSRSFGLVIVDRAFVREALRLFEADTRRQPYVSDLETFIVSPENARQRLAAFLKEARRELLIYDPRIADGSMIRLLLERAKSGVDIRIVGKATSHREELSARKLSKLRLHIRAILRDDEDLFLGSQSLRRLELDRRREVGVIVRDPKVIEQFRAVFDGDWRRAHARRQEEKKDERQKDEAKHETELVSK